MQPLLNDENNLPDESKRKRLEKLQDIFDQKEAQYFLLLDSYLETNDERLLIDLAKLRTALSEIAAAGRFVAGKSEQAEYRLLNWTGGGGSSVGGGASGGW